MERRPCRSGLTTGRFCTVNLSGTTALLVEDDDGDALLVQEMLADAAQQVKIERASSLSAALENYAEADVQCVLLDLGLPDAHGLEALTRLRAAWTRVPIVVWTGFDDERRGMDALGAGAQDYLVKGDVDGSLLVRAMRYAMERSNAEAAGRDLLAAQLHAQENRRLERGLLPVALIHDPQLELDVAYRPGRRRALLGGDFYDAVETPDGSVLLVIGDVCGHGPDEAALGVCLRIAWRALALSGRPVQESLDVLEQVFIHERHDDDLFATALLVRLHPGRERIDVYTAGHPGPMLLGPGPDRTAVPVAVSTIRPPLGVGAGGHWEPTSVDVTGFDSMLLYTDGLIEGRIGAGSERLGVDGLATLIASTVRGSGDDGGPALLRELIGRAETLNGGDLTDDVALVLLSWA